MTDVNLIAHCGCGYRSKSLEEAAKHSDSSNHRMTIQGTITPTVSVDSKTPTPTVIPDAKSKIDTLRKKFNGGR